MFVTAPSAGLEHARCVGTGRSSPPPELVAGRYGGCSCAASDDAVERNCCRSGATASPSSVEEALDGLMQMEAAHVTVRSAATVLGEQMRYRAAAGP